MYEYNWIRRENVCLAICAPEYEYLLPEAQRINGCPNAANLYCIAPIIMKFDKHSTETLQHVLHVFWTVVPSLFFFALARICTQFWLETASPDAILRFIMEFIIIAIPTVLSVNILNEWIFYIVAIFVVTLAFIIWKSDCLQRARNRQFDLGGRRPLMLTLARSTINLLTALCILAIDFESFPKFFRKSRRYGAGLMDVGIGLFVFSMAIVSNPPKNWRDSKRIGLIVGPLLVLGFARTFVIMAIDYHQDEHEYGVHMNAFFTLALTKFFGSILSAAARKDVLLIPIGLCTLFIHETLLQMGASDFVMNVEVERNTFFKANREGLCSIPGFVALYLLTMYVGQKLKTQITLNFNEFIIKLKILLLSSISIWIALLLAIYIFGIARVTCNTGYVIWMLAIGVTMTTFFMFVFDLVLNTIWPIENTLMVKLYDESNESAAEGGQIVKNLVNDKTPQIPVLVESINQNGLTYFLLANILTGCVNIFLKPENRTNFEGILILLLYMFISIGFVYVLYKLKIRVA